jgi:CxxC motif-containing protein (DUF1111 family)
MLFALALACQVGPGGELLAVVEDGEWLPGGDTTNTVMLGSNAFIMPAANLDAESEGAFYSGNSYFNGSWVEAPSSTDARDGLGPLFNARTCSGCHFKDGRAPAPGGEGGFMGSLVRLSVPGVGEHGGPLGAPTYGGQLQDLANEGLPAEGLPEVSWVEEGGQYPDGTPFSLRRPVLTISELGWGELDPEVLTSVRVAPQTIGLGLLEAIAEEDLAALEDPEDADGDSVSGRRNQVWDPVAGASATGRFGWKAEQPTVLVQSAGAFAGDMGLTTRVFGADDCTEAQPDCLAGTSGGDPEVEDTILDRIRVYAQAVAVPVRRGWEDPGVLRGKWLFSELGCAGCHTPSHTTGAHELAALEDQRIWPYTDLLLHDMGEGLSDGRPSYLAAGEEWRTPPLWGLGLLPEVNDHLELLHDGRARGFAEAILWHGGEGEASRLAFMDLTAGDREAVVCFLESL